MSQLNFSCSFGKRWRGKQAWELRACSVSHEKPDPHPEQTLELGTETSDLHILISILQLLKQQTFKRNDEAFSLAPFTKNSWRPLSFFPNVFLLIIWDFHTRSHPFPIPPRSTCPHLYSPSPTPKRKMLRTLFNSFLSGMFFLGGVVVTEAFSVSLVLSYESTAMDINTKQMKFPCP